MRKVSPRPDGRRGRTAVPMTAVDEPLPSMTRAAFGFASSRHAGQYREIDGAPFIAHPLEVGRLLHRDCQPDHVVAAGLLHDVLEKTKTSPRELEHEPASRSSLPRSQTMHRSRITRSAKMSCVNGWPARIPTRLPSTPRTRSRRYASWACCHDGEPAKAKTRRSWLTTARASRCSGALPGNPPSSIVSMPSSSAYPPALARQR